MPLRIEQFASRLEVSSAKHTLWDQWIARPAKFPTLAKPLLFYSKRTHHAHLAFSRLLAWENKHCTYTCIRLITIVYMQWCMISLHSILYCAAFMCKSLPSISVHLVSCIDSIDGFGIDACFLEGTLDRLRKVPGCWGGHPSWTRRKLHINRDSSI